MSADFISTDAYGDTVTSCTATHGLAQISLPWQSIWLNDQAMSAVTKAISNKRAAVIKALAHPSRLLIAESLMKGEQCVCDLKDLVGADMSTVSKHLTLMREAGVLNCEKRGLNIYYSLACDCLGEFLRCVDKLATGGTKTKRCC
jgi:ArsR family transcriptional regulator